MEYGKRPDGTDKGRGYWGPLPVKGGGAATEYSASFDDVLGGIDLPTLVPTLTQDELDQMVNDIIPNRKPLPESIRIKAIRHAQQRSAQGMPVWNVPGEAPNLNTAPVPMRNTNPYMLALGGMPLGKDQGYMGSIMQALSGRR
jgi:hypothetical protein